MTTQQKYIEISDKLINVNHIVLVSRSTRHFDGDHIDLHLSNSYCVTILKADIELYNKITDFMMNYTPKKNVLNVYSNVSTEKR